MNRLVSITSTCFTVDGRMYIYTVINFIRFLSNCIIVGIPFKMFFIHNSQFEIMQSISNPKIIYIIPMETMIIIILFVMVIVLLRWYHTVVRYRYRTSNFNSTNQKINTLSRVKHILRYGTVPYRTSIRVRILNTVRYNCTVPCTFGNKIISIRIVHTNKIY